MRDRQEHPGVCCVPAVRGPGQHGVAGGNCAGVVADCDQPLELSQRGLIAESDGVTEEVLQRLARPLGDELERFEGGFGLARLDEVDGGPADVALGDLAETQSCLHAGLLDRAWPHF